MQMKNRDRDRSILDRSVKTIVDLPAILAKRPHEQMLKKSTAKNPSILIANLKSKKSQLFQLIGKRF